jgi:hypothetical protein
MHVQSVAGSSAMDSFESLFGVSTGDPDSWLKQKGSDLGREVMGKLMQSIYTENSLEPPADAIGVPALIWPGLWTSVSWQP